MKHIWLALVFISLHACITRADSDQNLAEDVDNDIVSAVLEDNHGLNIQEGLIAGKRKKRSPRRGKGGMPGQKCPKGSRKGKKGCTDHGEATMFQERWVHGKTGACGFEKPFSDHAEGFFTAVGTADWEEGFACGTCAEIEYRGRVITVNVVDRCGACSKGWFDLGGPAWSALTGGEPPGHIYGVKSRWVACPGSLTGGNNMHLYVKPGSHPWDARFQPISHTLPIRSLEIDGGTGWKKMRKCENYMFCKPRGITLHGNYAIRVTSDSGNIDITMDNIPEGKYIDTGTNNGGTCSAPSEGSKPVTIPTPRPRHPVPTTASTTTPFSSASYVDCSVQDGLFPDPHNCRGFIKCAQGDSYPMECGGGLYFDIVTYNCNWARDTNCNGRPVW